MVFVQSTGVSVLLWMHFTARFGKDIANQYDTRDLQHLLHCFISILLTDPLYPDLHGLFQGDFVPIECA